MTERPVLRALAERAGIIPEFIDCSRIVRVTTDTSRELLLAAMGFEASDEAAAERSLKAMDRQEQERLVDPVWVLSGTATDPAVLSLRVPLGESGLIDWRIELCLENGQSHQVQGQATLQEDGGTIEIPLPDRPEWGYHTLRAEIRSSRLEQKAEQALIVTPEACLTPADLLGDQRIFGLWANLYTIRSQRNWGVGDFTDLRKLLSWANEIGAGFVGLNPLHAHRNRDIDISPYRPVSRFYRNMLYLDVAVTPELAGCTEAKSMMESSEFERELQKLRNRDYVDYEGIASLQRPILEELHRTFAERHRRQETSRGRAYARFLAQEGEALGHFATFQALEEHFNREGVAGSDWRDWPVPYRDPSSAEVKAFADEHAEDIDFHCYVQFELDRQLALVSKQARAAGMPIGVYQDLAIGTAPNGSEPWAYPDLFVAGASVGAPPDPLGPLGQDWQLPPIHPQRLTESCYAYWIQLLRRTLAHSGALRIDHVMGLTRQFWIPVGQPAREGAYVRYPCDDLFGILALESHRHRALIVGEDLGTVPPGFDEVLKRRGVLSSRVLYFEQDSQGEFLPSSHYSKRALVTVNTHDLAPLASYWQGRDLILRREVGQIASEEQLAEAQDQREHLRRALLRRLSAEGLLTNREDPSYTELCVAVHAFLGRAPAPLIGLSLDDLAAETEPVNLPGVEPSVYPNWSRRMRVSLEELPSHPTVHHTIVRMRHSMLLTRRRRMGSLG